MKVYFRNKKQTRRLRSLRVCSLVFGPKMEVKKGQRDGALLLKKHLDDTFQRLSLRVLVSARSSFRILFGPYQSQNPVMVNVRSEMPMRLV